MSGLKNKSNSYKPFYYPWAMQLAVKSEEIHWTEHEVALGNDVAQWKNNELSPEEKNHITQILRLFTQTDVEVAGNYTNIFLRHFKNNEIQSMLLSFAAREGVHQRAYALLNDTLGFPYSEYTVFLKYNEMVEKINFIQSTYLSGDEAELSNETLGLLLAQAVCNEGVSLFSAFAMLLSYQRFGKMRDMCTIVEWSIRDETTHADGMALLFREFCKENPSIVTDKFKTSIYELFKHAIELENAVIDLSFEMGPVADLTADDVKNYVEYMADRRLLQLGMKPIFETATNPLPWTDFIMSGDTFKNFFEGRVTDYAVNNLINDWGWQ